MEILRNEISQQTFRDAWNQTDKVFIDLEETLVTEVINPGYSTLLARYKSINVEAYAKFSGVSQEQAQIAVDEYRRRYSGRGELIYQQEFGSFTPWFDALSSLDSSLFIKQSPQVMEFLTWVKQQDKKLVLVSNTPLPLAYSIMDSAGIDTTVFDAIVTWETPEQAYPKDDDGKRWEELFREYPGKKIMTIGDSRFDYEPATQRGHVGIGVGPIAKGNYSFWINSVYEIPQLVEGGFK